MLRAMPEHSPSSPAAEVEVVIYHNVSLPHRSPDGDLCLGRFVSLCENCTVLEAYRYHRPAAPSNDPEDLLELVWAENNAVFGNEVNIRHRCRSLSMGDGVGIGGMFWAVEMVGFRTLEFSLAAKMN